MSAATTAPALDAARLSAVEDARSIYASCAEWLWHVLEEGEDSLWWLDSAALQVDAASLAYDLANAEASIERTRASVAW